ncbi:NADP-dependent oxidoreductase [Streptomyces coelicoflavus]|uniref:NADP-dependent oxidoreductase n=1 Tax=Streptomyces coelicoflavus TaxID=285562 RepID=UPI003650221C
MRAFVRRKSDPGGVEPADVPVPRHDDDELLVKVMAVGVGVHDPSFLPGDAGPCFPVGIEAAGVVERVGDGVHAYRPGDRVAFISAMQPKGGTWAEYAVVGADSPIVTIPAGMDFVEAAAVPVAGSTVLRAVQALDAGVPADGTLFVAGGSGAIGTLAVQVARSRGWRVAASASERNHDFLRALGAETAVDYHDRDWPDRIRRWRPEGVEAVIAVLPGTSAECLPVVRDGGVLVTVSGDVVTPERGVRVRVVPHDTDIREGLVRLTEEIARGDKRVEVERVHPFDEAPAALAKVRTGHARGKIVLRLDH